MCRFYKSMNAIFFSFAMFSIVGGVIAVLGGILYFLIIGVPKDIVYTMYGFDYLASCLVFIGFGMIFINDETIKKELIDESI